MADLYAVVKRHMDVRGMSLRALAKAVHHDPAGRCAASSRSARHWPVTLTARWAQAAR
jgi:hypothetical protein